MTHEPRDRCFVRRFCPQGGGRRIGWSFAAEGRTRHAQLDEGRFPRHQCRHAEDGQRCPRHERPEWCLLDAAAAWRRHRGTRIGDAQLDVDHATGVETKRQVGTIDAQHRYRITLAPACVGDNVAVRYQGIHE
jgi:hypothetical protein